MEYAASLFARGIFFRSLCAARRASQVRAADDEEGGRRRDKMNGGVVKYCLGFLRDYFFFFFNGKHVENG